jgi:hypothetical protein
MASEDDLRGERDSLEKSLGRLSWWMIGFTAFLVVGLFIELYALFVKFPDIHQMLEKIGQAVVAAGVTGELLILLLERLRERRLSTVNADIDRESQLDIRAADERIAEAERAAAEANERAAQAEARAAEAHERAARIESTKWTQDKFGKPW